jgi:peptidoglycan/LPS O-acetylase OafA/YrhL
MYVKSLTGLRCIAVMLVLLSHSLYISPVRFFALGNIGVDIFFTLSGFLITGVLLKERQKITNRYPLKKSLLFFYIRRALRILPLYYIVILICWAIKYPVAKECYLWLLTFTSNLQLAYGVKQLHFGGFGPFWSLSVEEQFYIFFPLLIFSSLSVKWIGRLLILMLMLSPIFRIYLFYTVSNPAHAVRFSTIACFDSLSAGALLAVYQYHNFFAKAKKIFYNRFFITLAGIIFLLLVSYYRNDFAGLIFGRSVTALITAALIFYCIEDRLLPAANQFLLLPPVQYIGKISYGIYVFHSFIIELVTKYATSILPPRFPLIILALAGSIAVAAFSWEFLEKRMLRLKAYFVN